MGFRSTLCRRTRETIFAFEMLLVDIFEMIMGGVVGAFLNRGDRDRSRRRQTRSISFKRRHTETCLRVDEFDGVRATSRTTYFNISFEAGRFFEGTSGFLVAGVERQLCQACAEHDGATRKVAG